MLDRSTSRVRIGATASWMVLGLLLACGGEAVAQTAPASGDPAAAPQAEDDAEAEAIIVVGSRASQQSSNARKKNARTATDSIVADDIGSFPDRNVNEAISRVPGVALGRNEFGEGDSVAIRGNGPGLTRVELDGIGVQSTNALATPNATGRGADLRELPAELVKSVDIIKGATADMTEGSLGGSVQIKTRTGLDFKKPYFSVRAGAQQNSLGRDWTPDVNGVAATRLFGDRVGIIASGTYSKIQNNGHGFENTTSNNRGYSRLFDFDQSSEKTFSFNPATVGTDAADVAFANSTAPDGTTLTPRELVTLAAGATSKAQCLQIFPNLPRQTTGNATTAAQIQQRTLEQQTCLNQWNDYTPSLIRNFMNEQTDERYSFDARIDYRVTDNLTVFAKGTIANRRVHDQNRSRNPVTLFNQNLNGTFVDTAGSPYRRNVSPNAPAGYYLFDPLYGYNVLTSGSNASTISNPVTGNVLNVVPGSVKVDSAHNVTEMTLTNNSVSIDQIENTIDTKTKYAQAGAEYHDDNIEAELWGGYTKATTTRADMRTSRAYAYGDATLTLQPNGLWDVALPSNYDETNPANFVQLNPPACVSGGTNPATCTGQNAVNAGPNGPATPAYLVSQMPLVTPNFQVQYTPAEGQSTEKIAKFDFAYKTNGAVPFFTRFKVGAQYRANDIKRWNNGGYTVSPAIGTFGTPGYVPAVIVPTAIVRGSYRACLPTTGSSAPGGLSCNYGFVPSTNPANVRSGVATLTPDQLRALFAGTLEPATSQYFGDLPNRGNLPPAWQGIRTDELFAQLGASQFMNTDCLKTCMGSDGNMYDQPVTRAKETIKNIYAMFDFSQPLPWGIEFDGNVGVRGVFRTVKGSGLQTIRVVRTTAAYNPANPNAAAGIINYDYSQPVTIDASTRDWLPIGNFNLWGFDRSVVLRLYGGKTLAWPNMNNMVPGGTCTVYDERQVLNPAADDPNSCPSGRVGNPGLKPFTAWNYNASLEWYPNADTLFAVTYGKLDVKIGNPINVTELRRPFAGSTQTNPVTGEALSDVEFLLPTYANGPGYKRDIWEFAVKTAYTFLPGFLKHTGVDANLSILSSAVTSGQQDPLTGDVMAPPDESKYYANASLWYDDGKLNVRLSYQYRTERFSCITPCGGNTTDINYPGEQWTNVRLVAPGYNPGVPRFEDESTFIDAKISYNITRNFQVYVEGRNLRREAQTVSTGGYTDFADGTPKIMRLMYGGRRIMGGARIQFGN